MRRTLDKPFVALAIADDHVPPRSRLIREGFHDRCFLGMCHARVYAPGRSWIRDQIAAQMSEATSEGAREVYPAHCCAHAGYTAQHFPPNGFLLR